eukprot:8311878-Pyramimonas_sp.AAC.1
MLDSSPFASTLNLLPMACSNSFQNELVVVADAEVIIVGVHEDHAEEVGVDVIDEVELGLDGRLLPAGVV